MDDELVVVRKWFVEQQEALEDFQAFTDDFVEALQEDMEEVLVVLDRLIEKQELVRKT